MKVFDMRKLLPTTIKLLSHQLAVDAWILRENGALSIACSPTYLILILWENFSPQMCNVEGADSTVKWLLFVGTQVNWDQLSNLWKKFSLHWYIHFCCPDLEMYLFFFDLSLNHLQHLPGSVTDQWINRFLTEIQCFTPVWESWYSPFENSLLTVFTSWPM